MKTLAQGTVHKLPADMRAALLSSDKVIDAWNSLTPLARNEWICWTVSGKKRETRDKHLKRLVEDLAKGKRRPCCWIGCIHRADKKVSPSVGAILKRKSKK